MSKPSTIPLTPNKFAAILQARQGSTGEEPAAASAPPAPIPAALRQPLQDAPAKTRLSAHPSVPTASPLPVKKSGMTRGKGKKGDPRFKQVTAYIPDDLHTKATIALRLTNQVRIDAEKEDFSELLTRLLANWYESQTYYKPNV